jgi:hypothetical protein
MRKPYLEITYRQGKPFAAYLYLDRKPNDKAAKSERHDAWVIDFAADGRAIGIEFIHVGSVDLVALNRVLALSHQPTLSVADLVPLTAA